VAIAQELGLGFTSNGRTDSVTVFDLNTLAIVDTVKVTGKNPDAILYEPLSRRVLTFNGGSANVTVIDAASRKIVGTIAVSGKPEFAVADERGRVFVNSEDRNSLTVIDPAALTVSNDWALTGCDEPTGLDIDRAAGRLFSVCHNRKMVVIDTKSGEIIASLPIGASVDGVVFDPAKDLAFSSNGDGTVTIVSKARSGRYEVLGNVETQKVRAPSRSNHRRIACISPRPRTHRRPRDGRRAQAPAVDDRRQLRDPGARTGLNAEVLFLEGSMDRTWKGVFPALTTKFREDLSLDIKAMEKHFAWQIDSGVDGLIVCGSLGENSVLTVDEKVDVLRIALRVAGRKLPVLMTIAEEAPPRPSRSPSVPRRKAPLASWCCRACDTFGPARDARALPGHRPIERAAHHGLQQPGFMAWTSRPRCSAS
jgi:hypothetical protein